MTSLCPCSSIVLSQMNIISPWSCSQNSTYKAILEYYVFSLIEQNDSSDEIKYFIYKLILYKKTELGNSILRKLLKWWFNEQFKILSYFSRREESVAPLVIAYNSKQSEAIEWCLEG